MARSKKKIQKGDQVQDRRTFRCGDQKTEFSLRSKENSDDPKVGRELLGFCRKDGGAQWSNHAPAGIMRRGGGVLAVVVDCFRMLTTALPDE
jgi:hypothetical protein